MMPYRLNEAEPSSRWGSTFSARDAAASRRMNLEAQGAFGYWLLSKYGIDHYARQRLHQRSMLLCHPHGSHRQNARPVGKQAGNALHAKLHANRCCCCDKHCERKA
jgi:hypothetical protein